MNLVYALTGSPAPSLGRAKFVERAVINKYENVPKRNMECKKKYRMA